MSEERDAGELPDETEELDDLDDPVEGDPEPDTGDEEPPDGDEGEDEPLPQPKAKAPGRRERQRAEVRELRERSDRLERELQSVRQQQQQPRVDNSAELARVAQFERDQLPLLTPDQQIGYWRQKDRQELGGYLQRQEAVIVDRLDHQAWQASCASNPRRARFANQVEQTIASMPPGPSRQREVVYKFLLGEEIDRQAGRQTGKQRQAAQRRVRGQTTQPGGSRSDAVRDRQPLSNGQDYEGAMARLRGKALW